MKVRLKINGAIMFFATLLVAIFPKIFLRTERPNYSDSIFEILGVTLILLGQLFRVSARGYKAEHSKEGRVLINGGPYALVRNPMYLGILLIGMGVVFMLFNWWAAAIFLLVFTARYILLIFKEEKKLGALFPEEYENYKKQVPRIFPALNMLLRKDICEFLPLKFSWIKKEIGSILAILSGAILLESWEDIRSRGLPVYFKEVIAVFAVIVLFVLLIWYLSKRTTGLEKNAADKS